MPEDNPYAAPQSLDRAESWTNVPQDEEQNATATNRKLYDDVSTARLSRMANWSMVIRAMDWVWGVVLAVATLGIPLGFILMAPILLACIAGLRIWGGFYRTPWFWAYNLIVDALLCGVLVVVIVNKANYDLNGLGYAGRLALVLAGLSGVSVLAHLLASTLYVHYTHRELLIEVRYRQKNQIP